MNGPLTQRLVSSPRLKSSSCGLYSTMAPAKQTNKHKCGTYQPRKGAVRNQLPSSSGTAGRNRKIHSIHAANHFEMEERLEWLSATAACIANRASWNKGSELGWAYNLIKCESVYKILSQNISACISVIDLRGKSSFGLFISAFVF